MTVIKIPARYGKATRLKKGESIKVWQIRAKILMI